MKIEIAWSDSEVESPKFNIPLFVILDDTSMGIGMFMRVDGGTYYQYGGSGDIHNIDNYCEYYDNYVVLWSYGFPDNPMGRLI